MRQVLFIQGGGAGTHDEWDDRVVASLRTALGEGFEVRYPRMPDEADPSFATWAPAIRRAIDELKDGAVVVGHSVGGTILIQTLVEGTGDVALGAIVLLAAPFVGSGGWPGDEFAFEDDLGARLPVDVPVHLVHGLADDEVPPTHLELLARAIPHAHVHALAGMDHQIGNDLGVVAAVIRALGD